MLDTDWVPASANVPMPSSDLNWRQPTRAASAHGAVLVLGDGPDGAYVEALAASGLATAHVTHRDVWWTDRLAAEEVGETAERFLVETVLPAALSELGRNTPIALLGFGPAGHGALRIAYKRARDFPVVAAWRPALACHQLWERSCFGQAPVSEDAVRSLKARYRNAEQCRQDAALLHIHPLGWPRRQWFGCPPRDFWWEGCDLLHGKLTSLGVPHECDLSTTANDDDPALVDRVVGWIADRLAEEARRID